MKYLFLLALLLIGYGSLYPFDFHAGAPLGRLLEPGRMSRGDLLQNIALFLPYGYLGMVAWRRPSRPRRFGIVVASAAVYGALLQWAQLYLPDSRDAALRDVLPNALGAAVGALAGATPFLDVRRLGEQARVRPAPLVLVAIWIAYRLLPFVPSLDWQEWKDSLKPLREWRPFPWPGAVHDAAAWIAVACLWTAAPIGRLTARWLPALALGTLALEVPVAENWLSPANLAGAGLGLGLAPLLARRPGPAALLLAAAVVLAGLAPFEARGAPAEFHWIPFVGFLEGSMLVNAASFFEKVFLYGSLVWLAREAGLRLPAAAAGTALLLAAIEAAQTRFSGHTPEVTDPLVALLAALFLAVADRPCPRGPPNPLESTTARPKENP